LAVSILYQSKKATFQYTSVPIKINGRHGRVKIQLNTSSVTWPSVGDPRYS
jgi:hypothetical protein